MKAAEAAEARKAEAQQQQQASAGGAGNTATADAILSLVGTRNFPDGDQFGSREIWV